MGDVRRFARPPQLCSWASLTPRHHESDTTVRRGHITKQGSTLVRWAAVETVQVLPIDCKLRRPRAPRRPPAAQPGLLRSLRDGHIRCLHKAAA
jgi:transposase